MSSSKRAAWFQSLRAHTALVDLMDAELRHDCDVPLDWYDVLIEIANAPGQSVRMSELADQVLLSRSWLTRRVGQLERAGLVQRVPADDDGRGVLAVMTDAGRTAFAEMEISHARSIRRHFSDHLTAGEADVIADAFRRIADHARETLQTQPAPAAQGSARAN